MAATEEWFPPGTMLGADDRLVVWCDDDPGPGLHSGFGLEREGESIFLSNAAGDLIDAFSFGLQVSGVALGLFPDGWKPCLQTPGAANHSPEPLAPQSALVFNEWQANPDAWSGRKHHWDTAERLGGMPMKIGGSGWYELLGDYEGPGANTSG